MYGAVLGDRMGAPYEFCFPPMKSKHFPLFAEQSPRESAYWFTDDTVMTIAAAAALLQDEGFFGNNFKFQLINSMQYEEKEYPGAGRKRCGR